MPAKIAGMHVPWGRKSVEESYQDMQHRTISDVQTQDTCVANELKGTKRKNVMDDRKGKQRHLS